MVKGINAVRGVYNQKCHTAFVSSINIYVAAVDGPREFNILLGLEYMN